jgi:hypothetical protein
MASPRHSFGAHDCGSPFLGQLDEMIQGPLKFRCLHVVSEAAKAGISPSSIDRVTTRMPQAAESSHMPVTDPRFLERARQPVAVELRIVSRARDSSNID